MSIAWLSISRRPNLPQISGESWVRNASRGRTMKNRRDFLRNTFGFGAGFAAMPRLCAAQQEPGAGMDMDQMRHGIQGKGQIGSGDTPSVAHFPWRMANGAKEFHLIERSED